ncbi:universal stress protein [Achromobacter xylosoxidans]
MLNLLVPVDGSDNANRAVLHARAGRRRAVRPRPPAQCPDAAARRAGLSSLITQDMIDEFYLREGQEAADEARKLLDDAGIDYTSHVEFGNPAVAINAYAREHGCQRIIMGSRGNGALTGLLVGSVANQVLQLADAPVTLIR